MKKERQAKLVEIVRSGAAATQDELVDALRAAGFDVSQATISRDIKELRLQKTADPSLGYRYIIASEHRADDASFLRLQTIFGQSVTGVDYAQNIVVIRTIPALASAACAAVDGMQLGYIVGSLAGDDTAIVITRDEASASELCYKLSALCEGK